MDNQHPVGFCANRLTEGWLPMIIVRLGRIPTQNKAGAATVVCNTGAAILL